MAEWGLGLRQEDHIGAGRRAILQLLDAEHAAVWPEIEAKIADRTWLPLRRRVDPHNLSIAKNELVSSGQIVETPGVTRGGGIVSVFHLADLYRRKRAVARAAGRKRLLQRRYLNWATKNRLIGPAGQIVAHASLSSVAPERGYRLENPSSGETRRLLGGPVPGGALDNAAHLQIVDKDGVTRGAVTLPIEVKNIRDWIYPENYRLHQLLYKGARLQQEHPDVSIMPVLVCRRAHITTFWMASVFGFYIADAKAQFVLPRYDVTASALDEIREELGYDLNFASGSNRLLVHHFRTSLPKVAEQGAEKWGDVGVGFLEVYERLRSRKTSHRDRLILKRELALAVMQARSPTWQEPGEAEPDWDAYEPDDEW